MSKKIFLDTNIIIDFLDEKRDNHKKVEGLIAYLTLNAYTIIISEDMMSTIFYIIKNKRTTLLFFQKILQKWEVVPYGKVLIEKAIALALEKELDLEDVLQCLCAKENQCSVLITEDRRFLECGISVMGTDDFLKEK
ncbi:MAG: type II toxin-antitoxin system VapC family toxin [Campylobacterota bacterium]|nr:type II toxin-antitoxin system VapC family toxin [Campylobacterota bacterium]